MNLQLVRSLVLHVIVVVAACRRRQTVQTAVVACALAFFALAIAIGIADPDGAVTAPHETPMTVSGMNGPTG